MSQIKETNIISTVVVDYVHQHRTQTYISSIKHASYPSSIYSIINTTDQTSFKIHYFLSVY